MTLTYVNPGKQKYLLIHQEQPGNDDLILCRAPVGLATLLERSVNLCQVRQETHYPWKL